MRRAGASPATAGPRLGGFNLFFLAIEVRRLLQNRRTVVVAILLPVLFYLLFSRSSSRHGGIIQHADIAYAASYVMISLAVYGSMIATTTGGAMVSLERAIGWSRQLRITPLSPVAYVFMKMVAAMVLGAFSVLAVYVAGDLTGAQMPLSEWIISAVAAWSCSAVFALLGLFVGYLMPAENAMQVVGTVVSLLAFLGGLFVPLSLLGSTFQNIARYTPAYGIGEIARSPLTGSGFTVGALLSVLGWGAIFSMGAIWMFRRDTARV